jgi:hypothetical protein
MKNFFYNLFLKLYFSKSFLKTKKDANYILAFQDELNQF